MSGKEMHWKLVGALCLAVLTMAFVPSSLKERVFRRYSLVLGLSMAGLWSSSFAMNTIVYVETRSPWALLYSCVMTYGPRFVTAPLGGYLGDRYPRRTIMLVTQFLMALIGLYLWWLIATGQFDLFTIGFLLGAMSAMYGLNDATELALAMEMLKEHLHYNARCVISMVASIGGVVGSALGGLMAGPDTRSWLLLADVLTYAVALVFFFFIPVGRKRLTRKGKTASWSHAFVYLARGSAARKSLFFSCMMTIFCANGRVMQPLIAYGLLGGAHAYSSLMLAFMVGSLASGLIQSLRNSIRASMWELLIWGSQYAVMVMLCSVFSLSSWLLMVMACMAVSCFGMNAMNVLSGAMLLQGAPNEVHARLQGVREFVIVGGTIISQALACVIAVYCGLEFALACSALGVVAAGFALVIEYRDKRGRLQPG